jgi:hypothetical protein
MVCMLVRYPRNPLWLHALVGLNCFSHLGWDLRVGQASRLTHAVCRLSLLDFARIAVT